MTANEIIFSEISLMKKILIASLCLVITFCAQAQDKENITRACLDYIEGFYEGDSTKLVRSLQPSLHKYGMWKDKTTAKYAPAGYMTYQQAKDYANNVLTKKNFAKADAPRKIEVLDIQNAIASAKVTAWWGVDYILLSKQNDKWMIEQVLWEGPLQK